MADYVAYHSGTVMGRPYKAARERFTFFSGKSESALRAALGSSVWVIASNRVGRKTQYVLAGVYCPSDITATEDGWDVSGDGTPFVPAIEVTDLGWFRELRGEQANFSLGFNPIRSASVISALTRIREQAVPAFVLPEEVSESVYLEGSAVRISVNRYERDATARDACLKALGTLCFICSADLSIIYGPIATGLIHVHHLVPLSRVSGEYRVSPETDLIPVCPNCHAVVHRRDPPLSPEEVRELMRACQRAG